MILSDEKGVTLSDEPTEKYFQLCLSFQEGLSKQALINRL